MTRFRLWLADKIAGPSAIVLDIDEFDGLFALATHRGPDLIFEDEDGDLYGVTLERSAN